MKSKSKIIKAEQERNKEAAHTIIRQCEARGYYNLSQYYFVQTYLPQEIDRLKVLRRD